MLESVRQCASQAVPAAGQGAVGLFLLLGGKVSAPFQVVHKSKLAQRHVLCTLSRQLV